MSEPRSRPVIFSAPMVRAILDGRKTQTRRIVKQLIGATAVEDVYHRPDRRFIGLHLPVGAGVGITQPFPCPYGVPGDRLWVRENWRVGKKWDETQPGHLPARQMTVMFGAGGSIANQTSGRWEPDDSYPRELPEWAGRLRPSIHMPRWAARIVLTITDVRVQRLRTISEADAIAEGCPAVPFHSLDCASTPPSDHFRQLWERINGPGSWERNPWVWAITFERVQ